MVYGEEGREVRERLWQETVDEFAFANVQGALDSVQASKS